MLEKMFFLELDTVKGHLKVGLHRISSDISHLNILTSLLVIFYFIVKRKTVYLRPEAATGANLSLVVRPVQHKSNPDPYVSLHLSDEYVVSSGVENRLRLMKCILPSTLARFDSFKRLKYVIYLKVKQARKMQQTSMKVPAFILTIF